MATTTYHGVGFRWGNSATSTGFGTCVIQSSDVESKLDESTIKNAVGEDVGWYGYNPTREASIDIIPTNATATVSASITQPQPGTIITITDSVDGTISGSNWIVKSCAVKFSNNDAAKMTVKATSYPLITT